jgi:hypothetical protein
MPVEYSFLSFVEQEKTSVCPVSPDGETRWILQSGLQKFLTFRIGIQMAKIIAHRHTPAGICAKFEDSLRKPVLGKLCLFHQWLASHDPCPRPNQKTSAGGGNDRVRIEWLSQMVAYRNQWQHPKEKAPEEILGLARSKVEEMRALFIDEDDVVEVSASGRLTHLQNGCRHSLEPFIFQNGARIEVFSEFSPPADLLYPVTYPPGLTAFRSVWPQLRIDDNLLENPTLTDLEGKALARMSLRDYSGEGPPWLGEFLSSREVGRLVETGILDGVLATIQRNRKDIVAFDVMAQEGSSPNQALADSMGIARSVPIEQLARLDFGEGLILWGFRANEISTKSFQKVLFFLADIAESGLKNRSRMIIERPQERIAADDEKLFDRLPENLDGLMRRAPRTKHSGIPGYVWTSKK